MRWGLVLVVLALVGAAPAAARQQGGLGFSYPQPSAKRSAVFELKVTLALPASMTLRGGLPIGVTVSNGALLPRGTIATAAVVATGRGTWNVFIVSTGAGSSAAKSLQGTVTIPHPLTAYPATVTPVGGDACQELKHTLNRATAFWTLVGPGRADPKALTQLGMKADTGCK